jgi:iron-sulfur cluster repair protein YtfE (RIC family)
LSEDDLATRQGLPEAYRYLVDAFPRLRWHDREVGAVARFWLQMHSGFRRETAQMCGLTDAWRAGDLALPDLHRQLIPTLQHFLQHLDGHHNVESHHYFPVMRQAEPAIGAGIDLLDRDHDAIHGHLETLFQTGLAFHQAVAGQAPDAADAAFRLADAIDRAGSPLTRHLEDEEDIVIPLMVRHADVFRE